MPIAKIEHFKNNPKDTYATVQDSIPRSTAGAGTITSQGHLIVGVGTAFVDSTATGQWLYIPGDASPFRQIRRITSQTELYIDAPFTTPLVASAYSFVPISPYREVSYKVTAGSAIVDGLTYATGQINTESKVHSTRGSGRNQIHPIDVNALAGTVVVSIQM